MADTKISALTSATTPLAGTEVLPIVQSGTTVKVTVANLTAGRAVSGAAFAVTGSTAPANGVYLPSANTVGLATNSTLGLRQDASQNLATGVTPSVGYGREFALTGDSTSGVTTWGSRNLAAGNNPSYFANNVKNTGAFSDGYWVDGYAVKYVQGNGQHQFWVAPSGTAGTAISGWLQACTINNDGNMNIGVANKGINFTANTPAAGMTSQLLNWYEEGTWTPNQGTGLTVVGAFSSSGTYTRIGRQVTIRGQVVGATSVAVTAAGVISSNLPYTAAVSHAGSAFNAGVTVSGSVQITGVSVVSATAIAATPTITFTATYTV